MSDATIASLTLLLFIGFILVISGIGIILVSYFWFKSKENFRKQIELGKDLTFFKVQVPEDNEVELKAFEQFYNNLLGVKETGRFNSNISPTISLEIVGDQFGINFYIVCPNSIKSLVEKAVHAVYTDAQITEGKKNFWNIWGQEGFQEFSEHYLAKDDHYPVKTHEDIEMDPLNSLTSVMSKMGQGEALAFQLLIRPSASNWRDIGNSEADRLTSKKDKDGNPKSTDKDREKSEQIKKKTKEQGFDFVARLFSVAPTVEVAKANLKNLKNSFGVLDNPLGNKFKSKDIKDKKQFLFAFVYRIFPYFHFYLPVFKKEIYKGYSVLNTEELATLFHFPNKNVKTPGIDWLRSRTSIAPPNLPDSGLYVGKSEFRGVEKTIYLKDDDRRRHFYIIGQTGTGKSELAKFLAIQDIKNGKGVAFIDPHGSAVHDILLQIPEERKDDVIYFNPGDDQFPVGLNILDVKTKKEGNLVVNSFIELLYKLYDPQHQGIVGPQLERAVRNAMLTVMEAVEGGTMIEVMRLILDEKYQKETVAKVKDPVVKQYWTEEMANTQAFHKSEKTGYFVSKFDRFATEMVIRNIVGQPKSSFDFGQVMKEKKILLVDLNKGAIGEENSKFLGLLIVPKILAAAFNRALSGDEFDDFYLYVDEFQNFSTPDFVTILSEARKYKLNLIVANQFLSQMTEDIKNAIFGNVGTMASFRVGPDDAKYMASQFEPHYKESDLINLQVGKAILRPLIDGHPTTPFSLTTDWPAMRDAPRSPERRLEIIELSRKKYARPAAEVESDLATRSGFLTGGETEKPASPFGASPFGGPRPSPFASPFSTKDDDDEFSSGKTPFSDSKPKPSPFASPFGRPPASPFGSPATNPFGTRSNSPSPFANRPLPQVTPSSFGGGLGSSLNRPGASPVKSPAESGFNIDNKNKPALGASGSNLSVPNRFANPYANPNAPSPFGPSFGINSQPPALKPQNRGAISLANAHKTEYEESTNTFKGVDKKPLVANPPTPQQGTENIPKAQGLDIKGEKNTDQ